MVHHFRLQLLCVQSHCYSPDDSDLRCCCCSLRRRVENQHGSRRAVCALCSRRLSVCPSVRLSSQDLASRLLERIGVMTNHRRARTKPTPPGNRHRRNVRGSVDPSSRGLRSAAVSGFLLLFLLLFQRRRR